METLFINLLKSSALIAAFYLAYHFLVRKETFFNTNRWFLLTGLFTALLLPWFNITKVVYVEKPKMALVDLVAYSSQNLTATPQVPVAEPFDWMSLVWIGYLVIALFLLVRIVINFTSLFRMLYNQQKTKKEDFTLVDLNQNIAPFSFFNYIVYNSLLYTPEELQSILLHEKVHSREKHSFDVIVAKLFCIIFWFNPFVWLYKKAIIQNLEFIADQKAVNQLEDKRAYQRALLKVVSNKNGLPITNNFYQSLIKKRIVMLNTNQSQQRNVWKYSVVIPVLIAFVLLFQIKVEAQTVRVKSDNGNIIEAKKTAEAKLNESSYVFDKISSDNELKNNVLAINSQHNINFKIDNIKRNAKGEIIAIKMSYNDKKGNKGITQQDRDIPIRPIFFKISTDDKGNNSIGFYDNSEMVIKPKDAVNENKIATIESIKDDALIYVDGEQYTKQDLEYLDPKGLEKIEILTDSKSLEQYGAKNKKEVIVVTTNWAKNDTKIIQETKSYEVTSFYSTSGPEDNISSIKNNKSVDYKKALLIFDGKEISSKQLEEIDPLIISTVSVMSATKYAMNKYGDKAKNGVIVIESQKYFEKNNPNAKSKVNLGKVDFKINDDNDGFGIMKTSNTSDLEFYKSILAKNKVIFTYSNVVRTKNGEITSISITLQQGDKKVTKDFNDTNGIKDIFIGKKKGELVIID